MEELRSHFPLYFSQRPSQLKISISQCRPPICLFVYLLIFYLFILFIQLESTQVTDKERVCDELQEPWRVLGFLRDPALEARHPPPPLRRHPLRPPLPPPLPTPPQPLDLPPRPHRRLLPRLVLPLLRRAQRPGHLRPPALVPALRLQDVRPYDHRQHGQGDQAPRQEARAPGLLIESNR